MHRDRAIAADRRALLPLLACFFLSGFAALVYETVWTRQFAFVFGTSELAIATVLAAYMGGLAAGAAAGGWLAPRVRRPVLAYGMLELAIAASALAVPSAVAASTALAVRLFGGRSEPPSADALSLALFYLACAFVILLVPTAMMGATLPLLARHAVRDERQITARIGALYGVNTLGAVAGTVSAAFVLIPSWGLRRAVLVAVAANALVFALAAVIARRVPAAWEPVAPDRPPGGAALPAATVPTHAPRAAPPLAAWRAWIAPLMLISGAVAFTYEVLWTRVLSHVLGGSTYAFATMLAAFLTGIALGSAVAARLGASAERAGRGLAAAELGIAGLSYAAFHLTQDLRPIGAWLGAGMTPGAPGNAALAVLVLLPAALCMGATFPLAVRVLARDDQDAALASARVYAWNTVGAIAGAVGAGFFLIPALGYAGVVVLTVAVSAVLALGLALAIRPRAPRLAAAAALALAGVALAPPDTPWQLVGGSALNLERAPYRPIFFAVGRSATVGVTHEAGMWILRTNGLPEGQILPAGHYRRSRLEPWLGGLPAVVHPGARSLLMIGFGAGTALEAVPRTIERIDVIELEPEVIEANRVVAARRAVDPLADPRLRLHLNDARGALVLTERRWDAIVSQPSHPWTSGASHLYTREFFALARDRLAPGGVFVQWIELNFVDAALLKTLVATLHDVFPEVRVFRPLFRSGVLFLAGERLAPLRSAVADALARAPDDLAALDILTPEDVLAALALDVDAVPRFVGGAPVNTDDHNLVAARASGVAAPLGQGGGDRLLEPLDPLPALVGGVDGLVLVRRLLADWDVSRAVRAARALPDDDERQIAAALIALATGRADEGVRTLREVLAHDPGSSWAAASLLQAWREGGADAGTQPAAPVAVVAGREQGEIVLRGWELEEAQAWHELAALEPRLAGVPPADPMFPDAARLRARWRVETGGTAELSRALLLLDQALSTRVDPDGFVLRARASAGLGHADAALGSLDEALDRALPAARPRVARQVAAALERIPPAPALAAARRRLEAQVRRDAR